MVADVKGPEAILEEINTNTGSELQKIQDMEKKELEKIEKDAHLQREKIMKDAEERIELESQRYVEREVSKSNVEEKLDFLRYKAETVEDILKAGYDEVAAGLQKTASCSKILEQYIIQAAITLDTEELELSANAKCLKVLTPEYLKGVTAKLKKMKQNVKLSAEKKPREIADGIIVTDKLSGIYIENTLDMIFRREKTDLYSKIGERF